MEGPCWDQRNPQTATTNCSNNAEIEKLTHARVPPPVCGPT